MSISIQSLDSTAGMRHVKWFRGTIQKTHSFQGKKGTNICTIYEGEYYYILANLNGIELDGALLSHIGDISWFPHDVANMTIRSV